MEPYVEFSSIVGAAECEYFPRGNDLYFFYQVTVIAGISAISMVFLKGESLIQGNLVLVTVGSAEHPMLTEHYIEWVLQTKRGNQ